MQDIIVSINELTKTYKSAIALDHVSLQVKRGEVYGLVGNNGAGKTTLMRLIAGRKASEDNEGGWGHSLKTLGFTHIWRQHRTWSISDANLEFREKRRLVRY